MRTLGRFAFPLLKRVVRVAGNVAQDVLDNPEKPVLTSLRDNTLSEVGKAVGSSINTAHKRKLGSSSEEAPYYIKRRQQQRRQRQLR